MPRFVPRRSRSRRLTAASTAVLVLGLALAVVAPAASVAAVATDGCYSWSRTLRVGMSGGDVQRLQVRVSGYPGYGRTLGVDGRYGQRTKDAVRRFQIAYGLRADGVAGPRTLGQITFLQDDDCTPRNFSYREMADTCAGGFGGGRLSAGAARGGALVTMWKLQALRRALGDRSITVASGFRSSTCNARAGGSRNSRHLFGDAADLDAGPLSLCAIAREARFRGFEGIYGPGYPNHDDHVHVDGDAVSWRAPRCGISVYRG